MKQPQRERRRRPKKHQPTIEVEGELKLDSLAWWKSSAHLRETNKLLSSASNELQQEPKEKLAGQPIMKSPVVDLSLASGRRCCLGRCSQLLFVTKQVGLKRRRRRRRRTRRGRATKKQPDMTNNEYPPGDEGMAPMLSLASDYHEADAELDQPQLKWGAHENNGPPEPPEGAKRLPDTGRHRRADGSKQEDIHGRRNNLLSRPQDTHNTLEGQQQQRHWHRHRHRHKSTPTSPKENKSRHYYYYSIRLNNVMKIILMISFLVINSVAHFNCLEQQPQLIQAASFHLENGTKRHSTINDVASASAPSASSAPMFSPTPGASVSANRPLDLQSGPYPASGIDLHTREERSSCGGADQCSGGNKERRDEEEVLMKLNDKEEDETRAADKWPAAEEATSEVSARDDGGHGDSSLGGPNEIADNNNNDNNNNNNKTGEPDKRPEHANVAVKHEDDNLLALVAPDENNANQGAGERPDRASNEEQEESDDDDVGDMNDMDDIGTRVKSASEPAALYDSSSGVRDLPNGRLDEPEEGEEEEEKNVYGKRAQGDTTNDTNNINDDDDDGDNQRPAPDELRETTELELDDYNDYGTYIIYNEPRLAVNDADDHEQTLHSRRAPGEQQQWQKQLRLGPARPGDQKDNTTTHQSLQKIFYAAKSGPTYKHEIEPSQMSLQMLNESPGRNNNNTNNNNNNKTKRLRAAGDREKQELEMTDSVPVGARNGLAKTSKTSTTVSKCDQSNINHQVQVGCEKGHRGEENAKATITLDTQTGGHLTFKFQTSTTTTTSTESGATASNTASTNESNGTKDTSSPMIGAANSRREPQLLSATYQAPIGDSPNRSSVKPWRSSSSSSSSLSSPSSSVSSSGSKLQETSSSGQKSPAESAKPTRSVVAQSMAFGASTRLGRQKNDDYHHHHHEQHTEAQMSTPWTAGGSHDDHTNVEVAQRQQRPSSEPANTSSNNGRERRGPTRGRRQGRRAESFHVDAPPMQRGVGRHSLSSSSSLSLPELDEEDVKWLNKMNERSFESGAREEAPTTSSGSSTDSLGRDHNKGPPKRPKQTPPTGTSGLRAPGELAGDLFAMDDGGEKDNNNNHDDDGEHLRKEGQVGHSSPRNEGHFNQQMNNQATSLLLHEQVGGSPEANNNDNDNINISKQTSWPLNQGSSFGGATLSAPSMQLREPNDDDDDDDVHHQHQRPKQHNKQDHNQGDDDDDGDHHHLNETTTTSEEQHNIYYWRLIWFVLPLGATFGNLLVIMAVHRERSLQSVTNYFIVSLAFADLFVGLIVMPFAVYVLVNEIWELGDSICDIFVAVDVTSSTASILNLVAISIDRYLAIAHPIAYSAGSSGTRAMFTICAVWLISCAVGAPIILGLNTSPERKSTHCMLYNSTFIFWSSLTSFYVPCIIMIGLYWRIFSAIRSRTKKAIQAGQPALCSSKVNNNNSNNNNTNLINRHQPAASAASTLATTPASAAIGTGKINGRLAFISPVEQSTRDMNTGETRKTTTTMTGSSTTGPANEVVLSAQFGELTHCRPLQAANATTSAATATTTTTTSTATSTQTNNVDSSRNFGCSRPSKMRPGARSKQLLSQSIVQQSLVVAAATSGQLELKQTAGQLEDNCREQANHRPGLSIELSHSAPLKLIQAAGQTRASTSSSSASSASSAASSSSSSSSAASSSSPSASSSSNSSNAHSSQPSSHSSGSCSGVLNASHLMQAHCNESNASSSTSESTSIYNHNHNHHHHHHHHHHPSHKQPPASSATNPPNHRNNHHHNNEQAKPIDCANLARLLREEQRQSAVCLGVPTSVVHFHHAEAGFKSNQKLCDVERAQKKEEEDEEEAERLPDSAGSSLAPTSFPSLSQSSSSSVSGDEDDGHDQQHYQAERRNSTGGQRRSTAGELQLGPELSSDFRRYSTSTSCCQQQQQLASPGANNECGCATCGQSASKSYLSVTEADHRQCWPESTCSMATGSTPTSYNEAPNNNQPDETGFSPPESTKQTTRPTKQDNATNKSGVVQMARQELKRRSIKLGALIKGRTSKTSGHHQPDANSTSASLQQASTGPGESVVNLVGDQRNKTSRAAGSSLPMTAIVSDSSTLEPTVSSTSARGAIGGDDSIEVNHPSKATPNIKCTLNSMSEEASKSVDELESSQSASKVEIQPADKSPPRELHESNQLFARNITAVPCGLSKVNQKDANNERSASGGLLASLGKGTAQSQSQAVVSMNAPEAGKGKQQAAAVAPLARHQRAGSRRRREKNAAKRERKATKTLAIVLGIFLICWTPFFTCNIIDGICIQLNMDCRPGMMVYLVVSWLGYINSCVNPIIYTIFNIEFRRAFKKILTTKPKCCLD